MNKFTALYENWKFIIMIIMDSVAKQLNSVHSLRPQFLRLFINYPPIRTLFSQMMSFHKSFWWKFISPCVLHVTYITHLLWFYFHNSIWWLMQIPKLSIIRYFSTPCYFLFLRCKYSPQHALYKCCIVSFCYFSCTYSTTIQLFAWHLRFSRRWKNVSCCLLDLVL